MSCTSIVSFLALFTIEYEAALKLKAFSSVHGKIEITVKQFSLDDQVHKKSSRNVLKLLMYHTTQARAIDLASCTILHTVLAHTCLHEKLGNDSLRPIIFNSATAYVTSNRRKQCGKT